MVAESNRYFGRNNPVSIHWLTTRFPPDPFDFYGCTPFHRYWPDYEDYLLAVLFFKSLNIFSLFFEIYRLQIQNAINHSQNTMFKLFAKSAVMAKLIAQIAIIVIVFINSNFSSFPWAYSIHSVTLLSRAYIKVKTTLHRLTSNWFIFKTIVVWPLPTAFYRLQVLPTFRSSLFGSVILASS